MVLTEAFASGTPVVASDIAGYRDVVRDGVDGLLVPAGDPVAARRGTARPRPRPRAPRASMGAAARERAQRFAWPHVADEVVEAYEDAIEMPGARAPRVRRPARALGLVPADGLPVVRRAPDPVDRARRPRTDRAPRRAASPARAP